MDEEEEDHDQAATPSRSRRRTAKKVNYAKEQEFSDEDLFEDSADEDATPAYGRGRKSGGGRGRRSKGTGRKSGVSAAAEESRIVDEDGKVYYTEPGYDPSQPPLRERFPFLPEREEDGSAKIELIVGRRPVDDKEDMGPDAAADSDRDEDDDAQKQDEEEEEATPGRRRRAARGGDKPKAKSPKKAKRGSPQKESKDTQGGGVLEYEYLVKFRGRSYLHLEWMRGADLESMNKSAKGIYRRYLKKIAQGIEEDLENPEFDPAYSNPQKIVDEQEQEITVELSDKELLKWEKQREKELAAAKDDDDDDDSEDEKKKEKEAVKKDGHAVSTAEEEKKESNESNEEWDDEEIIYSQIRLQKLRDIIHREGPYYPTFEGCDNPYRDGHVKEAPRKPRASYLFFQGTMRGYFAKRNPGATQAELMTLMGNTWNTLTDLDREPFVELAREESKQYDKERTMMEKAQRPNEVWQPIRRCLMVLDRLSADSFAEIFLEPVDIDDFPDYEEIIDSPMDLHTVRTRLGTKKYQAPEQFARDMRKIWNNCKIYNSHGSAIWHVADYMSKQFERLYHAWVLDFRERYLRWADPRARPWDHTCRHHNGKCGAADSEMVMCDHCDAAYGIKCLSPPLKKVPSRAWHCPECKPKLKSVKGARMLSAVAENAARKRAELGDVPKKKVKQTMFLVKWSGLGYEHCTWETRADINDDNLIAEFRRLNNRAQDDSFLPTDVLKDFLHETKHVYNDTSMGAAPLTSLKAQLYAQTRAFQFTRFGSKPPLQLGAECGPKVHASIHGPENMEKLSSKHIAPVVECVADLLFRVERGERLDLGRAYFALPPPMVGEYDAVIPITSKGLLMNVGEIHGSVAFLGYRQFPDGTRGPAEMHQLIRGAGDKIIAVDGMSTVGKSFQEVIAMLRESGKNKFAYMRFLESKYSLCDGKLSSVGTSGRYAVNELTKKFASDRQRFIVERLEHAGGDQAELLGLTDPVDREDSDADESDEGSEGEFQPDSEDEELIATGRAKEVTASSPDALMNGNKAEDDEEKTPTEAVSNEKQHPDENLVAQSMDVDDDGEDEDDAAPAGIVTPHENTRSLAYRLLDTDVGYSSDEGGDEDCAFFFDGVDGTFTKESAITKALDVAKAVEKKKKNEPKDMVPAKESDFLALGEKAKLACAAALFPLEPKNDMFSDYPQPLVEEDEEEADEEAEDTKAELSPSPTKYVKKSTVKIEQVSLQTGEPIHVWANVEAAAATLQLRLDQLKAVLSGEYDEDIGDEVGGYKWRYAPTGAKVTAGLNHSRGGGGKKAKEAWLEFREKLYDPSEPHPYKNSNRLRDYQVDGVNWLASTWYKKQGCILADEMGLGKTVQIVCYIEHLFRIEKIRRPYLIVVPLSTVEHWRREFEGWTDMVCCIYHDRQRVWRDIMREYEWYYDDRPHTAEFLKFDVLVTTYDTLISDFDIVSQIPFRVAVVDEAHRLRNQKGKLLECMREVSARGNMQYGFQSRVLISGTPLQNDLTELWTLLNFIEPFKFPDLDDFQHRFGNMASREQVENLQKMISPYMLRRVKEDVAKDIPAKEETVIDVELTAIQKQYYRAIFEHNHAFLNMGASRNVAPKLMNIQMELRKVCNHPFLLDGVEHRESERQFKEFLEKGEFSGKSAEDQQHMLNEHGYIMNSGKMVLLDKLLPKLRKEGHKVLIFSQMVKMLDLLAEYCEFRDFKFERLDGRIRGAERQKAIDRFEREEDSFVFMLSTRAGGVGINLTAADICIIFDSDWNPQNDVQAMARCHRIGQQKEVKVFRLITSRSFEQEMFERASRKLGLEQAVLGTFEKEQEDDRPSQKEMEQLLKKGAYALLDDDNDEITQQFCMDDIDSILAKRTRTRVVEGAKTASWLNKQGMLVSKSKFTAEGGGEELDMDDPLFWSKVMPDFVTPSIMMGKLNDLVDEIEGRIRGPGRGKGRWKKKAEEEEKQKDGEEKEEENGSKVEDKMDVEGDEGDKKTKDATSDDDAADEDEDAPEEEENKGKLTRTNQRKVHKFMSDFKGMMQGVLDDEEELPGDEKSICQKLLLTISVKDKIFSEEQRREARHFLKQFEGDRRRRCRTSDQTRFQPGSKEEDDNVNSIPEELRIADRKRKTKRRKRGEGDDDVDAPVVKRRKRGPSALSVGDDGYLQHSDSEGDWSEVGEDIYEPTKKKEQISRKEARRRRVWGADDDAATAAGRSWPVFPRHVVKKVLTTVLDEVMKHDEVKGGVFSEPVSKEDFPEYYEQIQKPMDYSSMRKKLENGEYRSAQAMQKDFILILQNCRTFNASTSDIVKEARKQHMMRPSILKDAAAKHNLFLAEDGAVLEIFDDDKEGKKKKTPGRKKAKKEENGGNEDEDDSAVKPVAKKKRGPKKKVAVKATKTSKGKMADPDPVETDTDDDEDKPSKPRIHIKVKAGKSSVSAKGKKKGGKRKRATEPESDEDSDDAMPEPVPKKSRKSSNKKTKVTEQPEEAEEGEIDTSAIKEEKDSHFFNLATWKAKKQSLDGSFAAAREYFTGEGPWELPKSVPDNKFVDVAKEMLVKLKKIDRYSVFADAVSEDDAPGYFEIVTDPMDFGTMKTKVSGGAYGSGSQAAAKFYHDLLLIFDNCLLYNDEDGEIAEEAIRIMGMVPEAYVSVCETVAKKK